MSPAPPGRSAPPAAFSEARPDGSAICGLCPRRCVVREGETGWCGTRQNTGGELVVTTYGHLFAATEDPIEKKPLFHYRPGSGTFSVASLGCNLVCPFCQNHSLSRGLEAPPRQGGMIVSPEELVAFARRHGSASIAFTYSEPILSFEFARDTAAIAGPQGIDIIFVTNGQMRKSPAAALSGFVRAANIDLKSFSKETYRTVLGGRLDATLRTIEILAAAGVWIEITTLVVPGLNDSESELDQIARFIASVSPEIPWHISRFHGAHQWRDRPPTPMETLRRSRQLGLARGLKYVYMGNLSGDDGEDTVCPRCNEVVIGRYGYRVEHIAITGGKCAGCGEPIAGVGLP